MKWIIIIIGILGLLFEWYLGYQTRIWANTEEALDETKKNLKKGYVLNQNWFEMHKKSEGRTTWFIIGIIAFIVGINIAAYFLGVFTIWFTVLTVIAPVLGFFGIIFFPI